MRPERNGNPAGRGGPRRDSDANTPRAQTVRSAPRLPPTSRGVQTLGRYPPPLALPPPGSPVRPSGSPRTTPSPTTPPATASWATPWSKTTPRKTRLGCTAPRRVDVAHSRGKSPNRRAKRARCRSRGGPPSTVGFTETGVANRRRHSPLPVVGRLSDPAAPQLQRAGRAPETRCGCSSHPGCLGESSWQTGARLPDADLAATTLCGAATPD